MYVVMSYLLYSVLFILLLITVSFVHEIGHYLVALLCNVRVHCFSVGFGKELFGYTDSRGCRWKLCPILAGGFVKLAGDSDDDLSEHSFQLLTWWKKVMVLVAGPLANVLFAFLLLFSLFVFTKTARFAPVVGDVALGSPAEEAGILPGDRINMINEHQISAFNDIGIFLNDSDDVRMHVIRDAEYLEFDVKPKVLNGRRMIGISSTNEVIDYKDSSISDAFLISYKEITRLCAHTAQGIYNLLIPDDNGQRTELHSVVSIANVSSGMIKLGAKAFLWFVAALSVNLGIINLVPVPPLDGGRVVMVFIESLFLNNNIVKSVKVGFMAMGLMIIMTITLMAVYNDVSHFLLPR